MIFYFQSIQNMIFNLAELLIFTVMYSNNVHLCKSCRTFTTQYIGPIFYKIDCLCRGGKITINK